MGHFSVKEVVVEFLIQKPFVANTKVSSVHFVLLSEDGSDCLSEY